VVQRKKIADVQLLENVVKFLFDNIGNIVSAKRVADTLSADGRRTTAMTVDNYIAALCDCYILYKCGRYDVKGRQYLKSLEKYYLADIGLRNVLLGKRGLDTGRVLENIVYLELLRRGYTVHIGKTAAQEIDFVAQNSRELIYYQVAQTVSASETREREFRPLRKLRDNYKKVVLTMDELSETHDGIERKNIIDFLLAE
jgi:predicted AAA+ superfamily ATPase